MTIRMRWMDEGSEKREIFEEVGNRIFCEV